MANPTPAAVFGPNFTSSTAADTITFKYAGQVAPDDVYNLPEITDAEVVPGTGDARALIYGLLDRLADWYEAEDPKPEFIRVTRSGTLTNVGGVDYVSRSYNVTFKALAGPMTLPVEP